MTPEQCREARGLLGWSAEDLRRLASVSKKTVLNFERGKPGVRDNMVMLMQSALENHGIVFAPEVAESIQLADGTTVRLQGRKTFVFPDGSVIYLVAPEVSGQGHEGG